MPEVDPATIELLVLDVDGVLTDGRIIFDDAQRETKTFHVRDGSGLNFWHRSGKRSALLTGRKSPVVERRAQELGVSVVRQGALVKLPAFQEILAQLGVSPERTAYIGDDLPDLPPMRASGLAIAVGDAVDEVKALAHWVAPQPGGHGAVRWAVEKLLAAGGLWEGVLQRYE